MPSEEWKQMINSLGEQYGKSEEHPFVSPELANTLESAWEVLKGAMSNAPAGDLLRLAGVEMPEGKKATPEEVLMNSLFLTGGILKADAVENLAEFLRKTRATNELTIHYRNPSRIRTAYLRAEALSPYVDEAVRATERTPQEALDKIKYYYFNALEEPNVSGRYRARGPTLTINPRKASKDVVPHEIAHHLTAHPIGEEMTKAARTIRVNKKALRFVFDELQKDDQFDLVDESKFYHTFDPNERVSREFARRLPPEELSWEDYAKLYTDVAKEVGESSNAQLDYLEQVIKTKEGLLPQDIANLMKIGLNPRIMTQFTTKPGAGEAIMQDLVDQVLGQGNY